MIIHIVKEQNQLKQCLIFKERNPQLSYRPIVLLTSYLIVFRFDGGRTPGY
jgi:hypothetical protein